jgi:1,2-phenylacetyl-CoA epoxidase PaaB subunit
MPRWRVDLIGKKLQHVGTVDAANEREARAEAIKIFEVRPALRSKLVVAKVKNRFANRPFQQPASLVMARFRLYA